LADALYTQTVANVPLGGGLRTGGSQVIEVDAGILASARVSVGLAFGLYTYFVFAPPIKALYARIRSKAKR
jgi:hypothetical protein